MSEPNCIIEARHPKHGNNWDSDYVGSESFPLSEGRKWLAMLNAREPMPDDSEWDEEWEFRLLIEDEYGAYRPE